MADNILNARIKLKYDTYANWESAAVKNTFVPLAGEVILYQIPAQQTATGLTPPTVGVKVGDGITTVGALPWIQAIAGDVHSWAKAANPPSADQIGAERSDIIDNQVIISHPTVEAWLQSLTDEMSSMSGGAGSISAQINNALNALDVTNDPNDINSITGFGANQTLATLTEDNGYISATFQDIAITQDQVTGLEDDLANITDTLDEKAPIDSPTFTGTVLLPGDPISNNEAATKHYVDSAVSGLSGAMHYIGEVSDDPIESPPSGTYGSGDVITYEHREYVYDGTDWRELGAEGDYAIKGSIGNDDIASDAAIDISKLDISYIGQYDAVDSPLTTKDYVDGQVNNIYAGARLAASNMYKFHPERNDTINDTTIQDGEIKVTVELQNGNETTIAKTYYTKPKNLKAVATSADAYDLLNAQTASSVATGRTAKYFVWDCGDATHLID